MHEHGRWRRRTGRLHLRSIDGTVAPPFAVRSRRPISLTLITTLICSTLAVVASPATSADAAGTTFSALTPARLADTRPGAPTVDGRNAGGGIITAGGTLVVAVAGRGGVPVTGATAAAVNVTVTQAAEAGFVTVWSCGQTMPTASTVNYTRGDTVANGAIAKLGAAGDICVFAQSAAHVLVDVTGWFPAGPELNALTPSRLADTRPGAPTVDGRNAGTNTVAAGQT